MIGIRNDDPKNFLAMVSQHAITEDGQSSEPNMENVVAFCYCIKDLEQAQAIERELEKMIRSQGYRIIPTTGTIYDGRIE